MFAFFTWILLCFFRLNAGRILEYVRRGRAHYVMVVGLGEPALRLASELEGRIPLAGEVVVLESAGLRMEVVASTDRRVDRVRVFPPATHPGSDSLEKARANGRED